METLTIDASGDASFSAPIIQPGRYAVSWRAGTANAGTLAFTQAWDSITGDSGTPILDPDGNAYSHDLSAVTSGGFEIVVSERGTIDATISGGDENETLYLSVVRL